MSLTAQPQILGVEEPPLNPMALQGGRGSFLEEVLSPVLMPGKGMWDVQSGSCPRPPGRSYQDDS